MVQDISGFTESLGNIPVRRSQDMQGINSVAMTGVQNGQMNLSPVGDPVSRSLQSQIEELQKRILHISSDENMPMEEKQKKKQELENQIMELQSQLQQHLAELKAVFIALISVKRKQARISHIVHHGYLSAAGCSQSLFQYIHNRRAKKRSSLLQQI